MRDIHCKSCNRFLCKLAFGELEIKCPNNKCKTINTIKLTSYKHLLTVEPIEDIIRS